MEAFTIPVDLFNPGQIFACMGFLEAADILLGDAEGGFDWSDEANTMFCLQAAGAENPFAVVLEFLATAELQYYVPVGYEQSADLNNDVEDKSIALVFSDTFPAAEADRMSLPIQLSRENTPIVSIGHWADCDSSRKSFKLYSGNRSAYGIAHAMLSGTRAKATKKQEIGDLKTKGIADLWKEQPEALIHHPFLPTPMGGSFNFDPRGAWTAIDAGYSPNDQKHQVSASPVLEFLAAWGLENTRPDEFERRKVRYAAWGLLLPPQLARVALCGGIPTLPIKSFRFELDESGKNKVVTFAELETRP